MKRLLDLILRRKAPPRLPEYPRRGQEADWMRARVIVALRDHHPDPGRLFDPTSGDYLPKMVHVGGAFDAAALAAYRELKADFPELVESALEAPGFPGVSRIADPEDLAAHAHRIRL